MTENFDSESEFDDALRRAADARLTDAAKNRHRAMLATLTDEMSDQAGPSQWWRRRAALVATVAVVAVGAGVGTAAAVGAFRTAHPPDRRIAHCYTTPSLSDPKNSEDFAVATGASGGNPSLRDAATSALDICRGGWLQGRYSGTDPKVLLDPKPSPWNYPVPPLIACVLKNGQVGVFPGTASTCGQLDLAVALL